MLAENCIVLILKLNPLKLIWIWDETVVKNRENARKKQQTKASGRT